MNVRALSVTTLGLALAAAAALPCGNARAEDRERPALDEPTRAAAHAGRHGRDRVGILYRTKNIEGDQTADQRSIDPNELQVPPDQKLDPP